MFRLTNRGMLGAMVDAAPSPLATPLAWDLVAPGYAKENVAHFERYAADAIRLAALAAEDVVIDVATGPGSLALRAAALVREVQAVDFSALMLAELQARAAQMGVTNVVAREGDGQALPYLDATFSAGFSMFGLMFFPDRAAGFRELARVLRPGGRAVVATWQPMGQVPLLMGVFQALSEELPSIPYGDGRGPLSDPDELRAEMADAGFDVTIEETTHSIESHSLEQFWLSMRESFAPLVLLEDKMGDAFLPIADGIWRRLVERFGEGPQVVRMPAWLALGEKPG